MHGGQVDALDVDRVAAVEIVLAHVQRGLVAVRPAGVVDHHVQFAVALERGLHQCFHVGRFRHVTGDEGCASARGHDGGGHAFAVGRVDVVHDDLGAFFGQALGNALAEAAACAGDDDGKIFDSHGGELR
ncbi:hypothetical protein FQZ97_960370 [compost metagenome]